MTKFNKVGVRPSVSAPIQTTTSTPTTQTFEGGLAYERDVKSELFLFAVCNMVSEDTFYENAGDRDQRFKQLVRQAAVEDPAWFINFIGWLRLEANMRSAPLVGALEGAKALNDQPESVVDPDGRSYARAVVNAALQRADEPGEALAYWTTNHGMAIPKPIKRGIADAVVRLYNEYTTLKYDTDSKAFRFGRVLDLVHPTPAVSKVTWQGPLFKYIADRLRGRTTPDEVLMRLPTITRNLAFRAAPAAGLALSLMDADKIKATGLTWEDVLSLGGQHKLNKGQLWDVMIPSMGYMALLRNLRNFDEEGISAESADIVIDRLRDANEVMRSRQLPMRFLSAYKAAQNMRWAYPLEQALNHSLANVPALPGRTLILIDLSGSMYSRLSAKSTLECQEVARMFGSALALRAESADLYAYDTSTRQIDVPRSGSVLRLYESFPHMGGGTYTWRTVQQTLRPNHSRVIIVTDEQAHDSYDAHVLANVPVYVWNLGGYRSATMPSGNGRYTFGGLSDSAFKLIPLLERGKNAPWPWEVVSP